MTEAYHNVNSTLYAAADTLYISTGGGVGETSTHRSGGVAEFGASSFVHCTLTPRAKQDPFRQISSPALPGMYMPAGLYCPPSIVGVEYSAVIRDFGSRKLPAYCQRE
ncbi:hypothetical protein V495_08722 [Pseudogymnoascus sp. VKM F-4514 (FW-929)]|nr:hypothetical protein V495_08722 [Pseudogymnoascus sp. VKM F-4514 (FW-929)]KFY59348.1 hypothetical protein V497_04351 [Pseudogymnoascus sp. VKM F-4516 (FW-969)]